MLTALCQDDRARKYVWFPGTKTIIPYEGLSGGYLRRLFWKYEREREELSLQI